MRTLQDSNISVLNVSSSLADVLDYALGCVEKLLNVPYDQRAVETCVDFEIDCKYILQSISYDKIALMHLVIESIDKCLLHHPQHVTTSEELSTIERIVRLLYNYHRSELGTIEIDLTDWVNIRIVNDGNRSFYLNNRGRWYRFIERSSLPYSDTWDKCCSFMDDILLQGDLDFVIIALKELQNDN